MTNTKCINMQSYADLTFFCHGNQGKFMHQMKDQDPNCLEFFFYAFYGVFGDQMSSFEKGYD